MNEIYLLQNQDRLFLSKQNEWVDGREPTALYRTRHKDEALNQLFEVNAKDYSQRIHVLSCSVKSNGLPEIDPADLPPLHDAAASDGDGTAPDTDGMEGESSERAQASEFSASSA
ncbi:hypothetical protein ACXYTJ_13935 [Gilvimarinus sp. F26214L]|uniref:hypothetical protein n=1 Tax=Gilvimarinus sp. DZF01 TaxID=3461371 RepID=UPI0040462AC2